ncbi:PREDICTED: uncharacterized protein LOC106812805 [Priapulus caudatus]|uniref:Uncharacterized protein LOC106812805 n=1 Tax=Priapulus caudatus TaxID=37621 RepID=A0ABM1EJ94_PRICU|nr:PREDICTED: uncharacterized protein LOC106812805 [Priapulus caudatus]
MPVPRAMLLVVSAAVVVSWLTVTEGARRGCLTVESSPVSVICLGYTNVPATFPNDTENLKFQESAIGEIGSGDFNVSGLTHLKTLDISSSSVWRLGYEAFSAVLHLQQLFLDNNQISIIEEDAFAGLTELWYLNLQSNNISYIPAGLFNDLHSLQHLSLLDNRLTSIDASVLTGLPLQSLTVLLLDRNPWTCNCSIAALGYWLVLPSTGLILDYSTLRCQDGEQALALLLASSQADYQMCPPYWPPEDIRAIAHPQCLAVRLYWRHLSEETGEAELYTFSSVDALGNASETEDFFSAYFIDNSAVTDDPFENATESVATATTPLVTGDAAVTVDMGNVTRGRATTSFHVTYWPDAHPDDVTVVETARLYVDLKDLKEGETYWVKIAVENEYGLGPTSEPSSFTTHDGMWNCSEAIVEVDLAGRTEDEGHGHIGIMVAVILTCIVLIIAVVLITRCTVRRRRASSVQLTTSRSPLNLNRSKRLAHVPTEDSISLTSAHSLHSISSADSEMVKRKPRPLNVVNRDRIKFIRNLYTERLYAAEGRHYEIKRSYERTERASGESARETIPNVDVALARLGRRAARGSGSQHIPSAGLRDERPLCAEQLPRDTGLNVNLARRATTCRLLFSARALGDLSASRHGTSYDGMRAWRRAPAGRIRRGAASADSNARSTPLPHKCVSLTDSVTREAVLIHSVSPRPQLTAYDGCLVQPRLHVRARTSILSGGPTDRDSLLEDPKSTFS